MLSQDQGLNVQAKRRIEELDRAFDYLTDPKKFRDFLELVNDKIELGTVEPETFIGTIARRQFSGPGVVETRDPVLPRKESSGPSQSMSLAEERQTLKELRKKRLAKEPNEGSRRRHAIEKITKETMAAIGEAATTTARAKASELVNKGVVDSDEFYERVYAAALETTSAVRDRALASLRAQELPIDETLLDEWETAVMNKAEQSAEHEYGKLEGLMAAKKTAGNTRLKTVVAVITMLGAFSCFCSFGVFMTANKPDALTQQNETAGAGPDKTALATTPATTTIPGGTPQNAGADILGSVPRTVSAIEHIAQAKGLASPAGNAGAAGAGRVEITGVSEYNLGCDKMNSGALGEAVLHFDRAVKRNSDIYQFFYNRGLSYQYLNHFPAALANFESALKLRTDVVQASYNTGNLYLLGGSDAIARAYLTDAKDKSTLLKQGADNLRIAIAIFSSVSDKLPKMAQPVYNRALCRFRLGDLDGALSDFQSALDKDPKLEAASFNSRLVKQFLQDKDFVPTDSPAPPVAPIGPVGPPGPGIF